MKKRIGPGRRPFEESEVERLLEAVRSRHRPEDEILFLLGADSGLRLGEIQRCRVREFSREEGRLFVPVGKMNVSRYTVVSRRTVAALDGVVAAGRGDRVCPYSYGRLSHVMKEYLAWAGLPSDLCFHSLRHTFATKLMRNGVGLHEVGNLLGHRWLSSTAVYLHVAPDMFRRAQAAIESPPAGPLGRGFLRVVEGGA